VGKPPRPRLRVRAHTGLLVRLDNTPPPSAYSHPGRPGARTDPTGRARRRALVDTLTGALLAWAAAQMAAGRLRRTGALEPVDAFGLEHVTAGCADVGLAEIGSASAQPWRLHHRGDPPRHIDGRPRPRPAASRAPRWGQSRPPNRTRTTAELSGQPSRRLDCVLSEPPLRRRVSRLGRCGRHRPCSPDVARVELPDYHESECVDGRDRHSRDGRAAGAEGGSAPSDEGECGACPDRVLADTASPQGLRCDGG
jgi:hypothetical protein